MPDFEPKSRPYGPPVAARSGHGSIVACRSPCAGAEWRTINPIGGPDRCGSGRYRRRNERVWNCWLRRLAPCGRDRSDRANARSAAPSGAGRRRVDRARGLAAGRTALGCDRPLNRGSARQQRERLGACRAQRRDLQLPRAPDVAARARSRPALPRRHRGARSPVGRARDRSAHAVAGYVRVRDRRRGPEDAFPRP
jgi:hypothetical protein